MSVPNEKTSMPYSEKHYFSSYDHYGIHEEMLKDQTRTLSYRSAIYQNPSLFKDKIVLDVGCGTGILSMFAARAGAKHVIGVDMSNIINMARKIVDLNGFSDKITLIQGKLEEIELPYPQVDIIVSEWMGYFLLYESMLDTVLVARDKYLKPDGLILPDKATIYLAGIEDAEYKEEKVGYWNDVYGFDYSPFQEIVLADPLVDTVELKSIATDSASVFHIDIHKVKKEDLSFQNDFKIRVQRDDNIHALIAWFDIEFSKGPVPVRFSTGPHGNYTHWKQTVFYLKDVLQVKKGEVIQGKITCSPTEKNPRDLDIAISYKFEPKNASDRNSTGDLKYLMC
ncbi:uncharacterized protein SAPINGB_P000011 [Magnusiomyces paraingens]|uniref:Uncharacterized protein n=1 Tax=Magnusiomyces paraingens TaxID=2606893 RepID=A0A5E8AWE9_9ASCO|nr:uncharacterized protein SAPINGB_P000011 [Saprochaete ingens]VVT43493.1 unnamed protein product [Saprochaete ingens]